MPVSVRRCHRTELGRYAVRVVRRVRLRPALAGATPAARVVLADLLENLIAKLAAAGDQCRAHTQRLTVKPEHVRRAIFSLPVRIDGPQFRDACRLANDTRGDVYRRLTAPRVTRAPGQATARRPAASQSSRRSATAGSVRPSHRASARARP